MKEFKRGITILTKAIKNNWTSQEIKDNDGIEQSMIFTDFSFQDEGRSRKLVCSINPSHPDYEFNAELIEKSPQLLQFLKDIFEARDKAQSTQDLFEVLQAIRKAQQRIYGSILMPAPPEEPSRV